MNQKPEILPFKIFLGIPHSLSMSVSDLSTMSQIIKDLSLEPVMRNSLVSSPTTSSPTYMQVTQPLCPMKVLRIQQCTFKVASFL